MKKLLLALLLAACALSTGEAQQVRQSGNVTPGHVPMWTSTGVIQDGGTAARGFLTSLGVTAQGPSICSNSAPTTQPYNQLCLGANTASAATVSLQNFGGASAQGLNFVLNGTTYQFPFSTVSAGTLVVPSTTVVGHVATWTNTLGTALGDFNLFGTANTWTAAQAFTGGATVLTRSVGDNTLNAASTAFVQAALSTGTVPITVGGTPVLSGTNGYFLYNNASVLGNFNLFGTANTWTATQTIDPTTSTYNPAIVINQTGPTTSTAGPLAYNTINVTHTSNVTGAAGTTQASGLYLNMQVGGANLGGQPAIGGYFSITEGIAGVTNEIDKIGIVGSCLIVINDPGGGGCYGENAVSVVNAGGAINRLVGHESDVFIKSGGAATYRYAYSAVNLGDSQASTLDTAFFVGNIGVLGGAFKNLLTLSNSLGQAPLAATATMFSSDTAFTVANVFSMANATVTGNILNFPNAVLTGNGLLTLPDIKVTGGPATLTTGQGTIGASANNGFIMQGFGAVFDSVLNNSAGLNVCSNATTTRVWNCNTLQSANGLLVGGGPPTIATGQGGVGASAAGGLVLQGFGATFDSVLNNSAGLSVCANATATRVWNCNTLTATVSVIINGSSSGAVTQTVQAAAGTPTITWGTASGTPAATASLPLAITAATGNITCATCATSTLNTAALTASNDTNVTLTLGGAPTTALLNAASITAGWTGTLSVARGGTGDSGSAWSSFTPSLSCGTATFTVNSATSKTVGKTTFAEVDYTITAIGTCTTPVTFTLPNTGAAGASINGQENVNSSATTSCLVASASTTATCRKTANAAFLVNDRVIASGVYTNQ